MPMLQEEFSNKLYMMKKIVEKKRMVQNQQQRLEGFGRNAKGELERANIQKIETLAEKKNKERIFNSLMVYVVLMLSKTPSSTKVSSQIQYNPLITSKNPFSLHSTPHKNAYTSTLTQSQRSQSKRLYSADVTRLTGSKFREG